MFKCTHTHTFKHICVPCIKACKQPNAQAATYSFEARGPLFCFGVVHKHFLLGHVEFSRNVHIFLHIDMHIHMYIYLYTYVYMYTYNHTCTYTYIHHLYTGT